MARPDEPVRLTVVSSEVEAEALRGLLHTAGIVSMQRPTDFAVGSLDGWPSAGGPREVLVKAADLERARELLPAE
jgi:Putative prokaryotic signal transducing protein